jgi:hypothetical protein
MAFKVLRLVALLFGLQIGIAAAADDFRNRDHEFASFRTRIKVGVQQGVNFAGHYSLIQFGCGTGCTQVLVTDVSTGKVYSFPRGGDDNMYLELNFAPKSSLIVARWFGGERCAEEMFVWRNERFDQIGKRDVGDEDACLSKWPN